MSGQRENNWLDELFREGEADVLLQKKTVESGKEIPSTNARFAPPLLAPQEQAQASEMKGYWRTLRAFFRTGKGGGLPEKAGIPDCYPALLAPFLHARASGFYPFWMPGGERNSAISDIQPIDTLLETTALALNTGSSGANILYDNLPRLGIIVRKKTTRMETPVPANPLLETCIDELVQRLNLSGNDGAAFATAATEFKKALPSDGLLVPFSEHAAVYILSNLIQLQSRRQKASLKKTIDPLIAGIRQLLDVEREKDPASKTAATLGANMDFADSFLNFEELASLLPSSGSAAMPEERLHRLEQVLQILESAETSLTSNPGLLVVSQQLADNSGLAFREHFHGSAIEIVPEAEAFPKISARFDQKMDEFAAVFAAIRIAGLELAGQYHHDVHGDFFAHFSWTAFSAEELAACPPFVLILGGGELLRSGLSDFSSLLASNRPIKYLALQYDAPGHREAGSTMAVYRQEPAALAVAHRDAYVLQTTVADSRGLYDGLNHGLHSASPAFFYVLAPGHNRQLPGDGLLWTSGAVGGREFPSFVFDHRKGPKWGSRFDISGNPQPEADWPEERLVYRSPDEQEHQTPIPFTFADFAAADPGFEKLFHLVPAPYWSDDLVPVYEYLLLPETQTYSKVPFIWMVDDQSHLQKAAVALPVIETCRERLDFWHFLQENAGVHSFHVEQATDRLRQEMEAETAEKIEELRQAHAREIENVREETTRTSMEQLAGFLLDFDTSSVPPPGVRKAEIGISQPAAPEPASTPAAAVTAPAAPAVPEPLSLGEAWIETPLCTSCNECINANDRIFQYNSDKQAIITNPAGGPFADIVKAAENCPVGIIHPGAPLNPNEPGLDALIKRAAKFN